MAKGRALSTGYLPRGGLPRNSVDRITDRPDMTSAVDRGRKELIQTNKQTPKLYPRIERLRVDMHSLEKDRVRRYRYSNVP